MCPQHPPGEDSRSGTSYGEPQASVEDRKGPLVSVGPNRLVAPLSSSAMVLVSTAITYPHPRHTRRSARQQSGQHGGVNPNLRAHSPQTSNPPDPVYAFAQVTGPRPQDLMTAKRGPFSIPPPGIRSGPPTTFPQVRGPLTHSVAGEGFEPSKLTRWIYRPWAASP